MTVENEPSISLEKAQETVAGKTAPKVTKESIEAKIGGVSYIQHDHLTIAVITMQNGFMVLGKAAPASTANYDPEVGKRYAYEDAFKQLWGFEGYLLRDKLHEVDLAERAKKADDERAEKAADAREA